MVSPASILRRLILIALPAVAGCMAEPTAYKQNSSLADENARLPASTLGEETALQAPGSIGATATPPPAGAALAPGAPATKPADARLVIYSAGFRVVVADVPGTIRSIIASAEKLGGFMQEVSGSAVTIRVPAAQFPAAVQAIEAVGQVVDRQIKAQDITEEMRDLRIRLDNAENLRKRLLDILAKADKVEDAIKVETELARVSEQIDAAKGKIRYLESQAAMSTLRVELNSPVPQNVRGTGPKLPFAWVEELGEGLVAGQVNQQIRKAGFFSRGPAFKPPVGFVRYYEESTRIDAMDAGSLLIRVQRRENVDKAPLEFWSKLITRSLVENRSAVVMASEDFPKDGGRVIRCTRDVAGKPLSYLVCIKRSNRSVTIMEAWGPKEQFDAVYDALRTSAASVDAD
jgi:hypothetical protein